MRNPRPTAPIPRLRRGVAGAEPDARAPLVLLLEDDPLVRMSVTHFLTQAGYEVLQATTLESALEQWKRHGARVDLILADLLLRDGSSIGVVRLLRAQVPAPAALVMSALSGPEAASAARLVGAPVLEKPFGRDELLRRVGELIRSPREARRRPELAGGRS